MQYSKLTILLTLSFGCVGALSEDYDPWLADEAPSIVNEPPEGDEDPVAQNFTDFGGLPQGQDTAVVPESPLNWHPGHYVLFDSSRGNIEPLRNTQRLDYMALPQNLWVILGVMEARTAAA